MSDEALWVRLGCALLFGAALGLERELGGHEAGLRTHLMVTMGACIFALVSIVGAGDTLAADRTRIASQVVVGIGFLGGGTILRDGLSVKGLTTAAGLWVAASVGVAAGFGMVKLTLVATGLALLFMAGFNRLEARLSAWVGRRSRRSGGQGPDGDGEGRGPSSSGSGSGATRTPDQE